MNINSALNGYGNTDLEEELKKQMALGKMVTDGGGMQGYGAPAITADQIKVPEGFGAGLADGSAPTAAIDASIEVTDTGGGSQASQAMAGLKAFGDLAGQFQSMNSEPPPMAAAQAKMPMQQQMPAPQGNPYQSAAANMGLLEMLNKAQQMGG